MTQETKPMDGWAAIDQERRALVADLGHLKDKCNLERVISRAATAPGTTPRSDLEQQFAHTIGSRNLPPFVKSPCELAEFIKNDRGTGMHNRIKGA